MAWHGGRRLVWLLTIVGLAMGLWSAAPAQAAAGTNTLYPGEVISGGLQLVSANKQYTASLAGGDLVIFRAGYGERFRSSSATDEEGSRLVFQYAGDLILVTPSMRRRWNTGTGGIAPGKLVLGDDGNLVLFSSSGAVTWTSGTASSTSATSEALPSGASLVSPNGSATVTMEREGNLVVTVAGRVKWTSGTDGNSGARAVPSGAGLVVMSLTNMMLWTSGTPTTGTPQLRLTDTGNLVFSGGGTTAWQSIPPYVAASDCASVTGPVPVEATALATNGTRVHTCLLGRYNAMVKDAAAQGITLKGWGWRDTQRQIELRIQNCGGDTYYNIWEKPSSQCSPPTAIPGRSMHERGLAIDFYVDGGRSITSTDPQFGWLSRNAAKYGLYNLPSENWHWSTNGG